MDFETIIVERGPVSNVIINRPDKGNSLSDKVMSELTQALYMLDEDDTCRVIVLSGAGKGFCSGGDLGGMSGTTPIMQFREANRQLPKLFTAIGKIGKIVISKVQGYALAGGLGLAVTCDMTVVADNAKLGTPEILRALYPFMIMAPISRCMPQKKMLEMCFTGENITPAQAVEYGIANMAVPADQLDATVDALAAKIAKNSPAAIRLGKQAFYTQRDMEYFKSLDYLSECLTTIMKTEDVKEGITAFFQKRQPVWSGR